MGPELKCEIIEDINGRCHILEYIDEDDRFNQIEQILNRYVRKKERWSQSA